ncbi:MAG TPA: GTPase ObgE [Mycoplasmatales bacterium]|nr:GTPase ObgE [Mycoplasmatales bacterium]
MKFIDEIDIIVKSGNGGSGAVSFLHTHLNPLSGPDGGEGGKGGTIFFKGSNQIDSFHSFLFKSKWIANSGLNGGKNLKKGKNGSDLYIEIPLGTVIYILDDHGNENLFSEITKPNQIVSAAEGGLGGLGNASFKSSANRSPRYKQTGIITKEIKFHLELKIISDVGLVGLPNAGKSTILNSLTNAKSKIGDFEFTTLNPCLGVINYENDKFLTIADLPGIIEGSSKNKGLGFKFLKHISRCKILLYILDVSRINDLINDFEIIKKELKNSPFNNDEWKEKESILILNKSDLINKEDRKKITNIKSIQKYSFFFVSSLNKQSLLTILKFLEKFANTKLTDSKIERLEPLHRIYDFTERLINDIKIEKIKKSFWKISSFYIEKISNEYGANEKILNMFKKPFVENLLYEKGIRKNDTISINNKEYIWA